MAMDDGRMRSRGTIEHIFLAAAVAGFALALGWTMSELDTALKDACASLATIATIGN
jgi:hypothetical protein